MTAFPSWWAPEEGPPVRFLNDAAVPKGWHHVPGDYDYMRGVWVDAEPDDKDELKALRAAYHEKTGKKPFGGWGADKLREKLAA